MRGMLEKMNAERKSQPLTFVSPVRQMRHTVNWKKTALHAGPLSIRKTAAEAAVSDTGVYSTYAARCSEAPSQRAHIRCKDKENQSYSLFQRLFPSAEDPLKIQKYVRLPCFQYVNKGCRYWTLAQIEGAKITSSSK